MAGQQVDVALKLVPEALITASVVDAATGQPLAGICVEPVAAESLPIGCMHMSDENGRVVLDFLTAAAYKLIAFPEQGVSPPGYGAQWVGARGGTGRQHQAVTIEVQAGQTAAGPVIRMDRAGTVTGRMTKADGTRPQGPGALAGALPFIPDSFATTAPTMVAVDDNGRYTLDFLGPYEWELFFTETNEAGQFSGGVANPLFATPVRVRAGATTTYDFRFRAAVRVNLVVTGMTLDPGYTALAHNAVTGYEVATETNQLTLLLVGPQFVKFKVQGRWFGGADFAHAGPFWIPPNGTRTITLAY